MKTRDVILTGILLVLVGVMIGMIVAINRFNQPESDLADVNVIEIARNSQPYSLPEELQAMDSRFIFQEISRKATPAVVYIQTVLPLRRQDRTNNEGQEEEEQEGFFDRFQLERRVSAVGSGVIISDSGYILTNNHVVENTVDDGISVQLSDKRYFSARIVGTDPSTDLAVIKVDAENLPAAILGNSDSLQVGEWVLAIGNPFSLQSTVTAGIVSALGRGNLSVIGDDVPTAIESFIQTDAAINRGNSGGALINMGGELIGINTAIATQNGDYQGYGFAVPSNLALKVARDIIEFGEVQRGFLGVSIREVNAGVARDAGLDRIRGVFIAEAPDGRSAHSAGIQPGDIVLDVNGEQVNEVNELQVKIAMFQPGDEVRLTIWRDGEVLNRVVVLGSPMTVTQDIQQEQDWLFDFWNGFSDEDSEIEDNDGNVEEFDNSDPDNDNGEDE